MFNAIYIWFTLAKIIHLFHFWSVRVNRDVCLIVGKADTRMHHDKAYQWAERRRLETHPTTGVTQLVEVREAAKGFAYPNTSKRVAR